MSNITYRIFFIINVLFVFNIQTQSLNDTNYDDGVFLTEFDNLTSTDHHALLSDDLLSTIKDLNKDVSSFSEHTVQSISHILDIYNSELLFQTWDNVKHELTPLCKTGMAEYIEGLKMRASWALKSKCHKIYYF